MDLKAKPGDIYQGEPKENKADCTLTLEDADMVALVSWSNRLSIFSSVILTFRLFLQVTGKLNAQKAYMQGKLKIKGNIMLTQKLQGLLKENANL